MEQMTIFDLLRKPFVIDKPIRLIELFGGIGSQAMALRNIGADFEHYCMVEVDKNAVKSYNAIHGTHFKPLNIMEISGADLNITETEQYCYILTYSFPCQDLSVAGTQKGFAKGSGTRSGLLWEVERLLKEVDELPQVLLMENVIQVHTEGENRTNFQEWITFLDSLGYCSYWEDLNAKDYGIPQNRNRCFMVSLLGEYNYKFPRPVELKKTVTDYLEEEVPEKYYLKGERAKILLDKLVEDEIILTDRQTDTLLTSQSTSQKPRPSQIASEQDITTEYQIENPSALVWSQGFFPWSKKMETVVKKADVFSTVPATRWKGLRNQGDDFVICKK